MAWPFAGYFVVDVSVSTLSVLQRPQEEPRSRKALWVYTGALWGFHLWYDLLNLGVEPSAWTGSVWVLVGSFLHLHSSQNWESPMCSSTELLGEELSLPLKFVRMHPRVMFRFRSIALPPREHETRCASCLALPHSSRLQIVRASKASCSSRMLLGFSKKALAIVS